MDDPFVMQTDLVCQALGLYRYQLMMLHQQVVILYERLALEL